MPPYTFTYRLVANSVNKIETYRLRTITFQSGERLPILLRTKSIAHPGKKGEEVSIYEPLHDPLLFVLQELRSVGFATNTMLQALRSIMLLLLVLDGLPSSSAVPKKQDVGQGIDLQRRLREGRLLEYGELEALAVACGKDLHELRDSKADQPSPAPKAAQLESVRMRENSKNAANTKPSTKFIRLHYIRKFLLWLADRALLRLEPGSPRYKHLTAARNAAEKVLGSRMPSARSRNTEDQRQGLTPQALERLLAVIEPTHPANPWRADTRVRNNLLVRWYLHTGLRRAELLVVEVADINFQTNEVLVARRPDDPNDPRRNLPNVKTADKLIPLRPDLVQATHNYVTGQRRETGAAGKHGKLFVATHSGAPLSMSAVNLIFTQLRSKVPELPDDFSPHVLRHTWNDLFSEFADAREFDPAEESKVRSRLMGWSETSGSAATYTRRHTKRKSREASLALQSKIIPTNGNKNET